MAVRAWTPCWLKNGRRHFVGQRSAVGQVGNRTSFALRAGLAELRRQAAGLGLSFGMELSIGRTVASLAFLDTAIGHRLAAGVDIDRSVAPVHRLAMVS